jgi:AraC-like DNA-binding protein
VLTTHQGTTAVPTVMTAWTGTLLRALDARGIDSAALVEIAGIDPALLDDPELRVPLDASTRLWEAAVDATQDPTFGIEVSRYVQPTTFHALGPAFLASATLRNALERAGRYGQVCADVTRGSARQDGDEFILSMGWPESIHIADEAIDAIVASIVRSARFMLDRTVSPTRLTFQRRCPDEATATRFATFFRCPIEYEGDVVSVHYDLAVCERRIPTGNESIAHASDSVVTAYLESRPPGSLNQQVERALQDLLPTGEPNIGEVARLLGTSSRTLQRQLLDRGTNFREILRDVRHDLAMRYLRESSTSITEVAFLLGFSETAAFSRAFKRWTGQAPSRFR